MAIHIAIREEIRTSRPVSHKYIQKKIREAIIEEQRDDLREKPVCFDSGEEGIIIEYERLETKRAAALIYDMATSLGGSMALGLAVFRNASGSVTVLALT
jgi:hypothetical protein